MGAVAPHNARLVPSSAPDGRLSRNMQALDLRRPLLALRPLRSLRRPATQRRGAYYEENYKDKPFARHAPRRTSKRGTPRQPAYGEALALCQATALRHYAEPGSEALRRAKAPALLSLGPCLPRQDGPESDASLLVS